MKKMLALVGIIACAIGLSFNLNAPDPFTFFHDGVQLQVAVDYRIEKSGDLPAPGDRDEEEQLVFVLAGKDDGNVYFQFNERSLLDTDFDHQLEAQSPVKGYFYALEDNLVVVRDPKTGSLVSLEAATELIPARHRATRVNPVIPLCLTFALSYLMFDDKRVFLRYLAPALVMLLLVIMLIMTIGPME